MNKYIYKYKGWCNRCGSSFTSTVKYPKPVIAPSTLYKTCTNCENPYLRLNFEGKYETD